VFYGLDFGANVWGSHLGVSTRRDAVARDFDEMARLGFVVVRWFLFCDGRSGIEFDDRGLPLGLDAQFFADLDAGLEIARDAGIRLNLVLFDHHWFFRGLSQPLADAVTGELLNARLPEGRARVLLSERGRDALFDRVLEPLILRYSDGGARADLAAQIFAFELMNEPDFIIDEWERDLSPRAARPLPFAIFSEVLSSFSELVHANSPALVTVGGARLHNLWAWDDDALGLDVLQLHSYPDLGHPARDEDVFGTPASGLGVKRRVILGEVPGNAAEQHPAGASPPDHTLEEYLEFALAGGYLGAWPWSFSGTDAYGRLPVDAIRRFGERHPALVNPRFRATRATKTD
jgi:hypothetical protein